MRKFLLSMALVLLSGATMAQNYSETVLTADDLNDITEKTAIAIKCVQNLSGNQETYYNGSGRSAGLDSDKIFYWVPVENEDGKFYIMNGNEQYMQQPTGDNSTDFYTFGEIGTAAKLHAINPTSSGATNAYKFSEYSLVYNDTEENRNELVRIALYDDTRWMNLDKLNTTGIGIWTVMRVYAVVEKTPAISNQLTAAELMAKTEPTYIVMKNLSRRNPDWYAGTSSSALITDANIFVWEPTDGGFRLKNLEGQYIQSGNENVNISFGTVDNAAVFTAVKPYVGGSETAAMDHDNDSNPYITSDQDENLVRFVNEQGVWINVQNTDGTPGTPKYNKGKGGWTIQYVYEVTMVEAYDVEITDAKYATFYAVSESTAPEGVEVYYVTNEGVESEKINLTKIENRIIPANTAVIIYSETAGNYEFSASTTNAPAISDNLLKGTPISTNITEEAYVLGNKDGVGLYKAITKDVSTSGGTKKVFLNNAGKAYLPASALPAAAQASNGFRFGEGTTGIDEVKGENGNVKTIYDLTGRRVEAISAPGIYIVGGKKVLVK